MSKITNISQVTSTYQLPDQTTKQSDVKSNQSNTENMTTSFTKVHSSAKNFGEPNAEIEQTITLTNNSEYPITNLNVEEMIDTGASFKEGSLVVDGASKPDDDLTNGVDLGELSAGQSKIIKYTLVIDETPTVESVEVYSLITYDVNEAVGLNEYTNTDTINISNNVITITKTSDKSVVIKGDKIKFQNVIENKGNLTNTDVTFIDLIPEGTSFVVGSVYVDGNQQAGSDPSVGFKIDDLTPNKSITITFEVTVD